MKEINIIAFDVPYPANYGGVIDVFYKIKHFHSKGVKIHLHCFEYGRGEQQELNKYCASVSYYKRKTGLISFLSALPYIVKSRAVVELKNNLLKNDFPILFEGLHTCFFLNDSAFANRFRIVRNHNIEHDYYRYLSLSESNFIKRYFFKSEAKKLEKFESIIKEADLSLPISTTGLNYFKEKYKNNKFQLVSGFHQNLETNVLPGKGSYVLYQGNLSVAENHNAARFIINSIFNDLQIPLKIAGLNPCKELIHLINKYSHIELIPNPTNNEMNELIQNAQINFLYTEQPTGLKLKLLNVLYNGRHSIVNSKMVAGTSLANLCSVSDDPIQLKELVKKAFIKEITPSELTKRKAVLQEEYSNEKSFANIISAL